MVVVANSMVEEAFKAPARLRVLEKLTIPSKVEAPDTRRVSVM